jgi:hypothetical protein
MANYRNEVSNTLSYDYAVFELKYRYTKFEKDKLARMKPLLLKSQCFDRI